MDRTSIRKFALAGGAAAIGAVGILGAGLVMAQSDDSTPTTTTGSTVTAQQTVPSDLAAYITLLASKLGIPEDTLKSAITAANLSTIDAQEAAGTITAARATELRDKVNAATDVFFPAGGKHGPGHGFGGPGGRGHFGVHGVMGADLATFLGITEAELRTAREGGSTLAQVAEANGKTRDQLKAFLAAEIAEHVAAEVTDGRRTQAQADAELAEATENLDAAIDAVSLPFKGARR